jgi:hypothetical protein
MVELKEKSILNDWIASLGELNYTSNNVGMSNGILGGLVDVEAVVKLVREKTPIARISRLRCSWFVSFRCFHTFMRIHSMSFFQLLIGESMISALTLPYSVIMQ